MGKILKTQNDSGNPVNVLLHPIYFIRFEDGEIVPAELPKSARQPVLTVTINGQKQQIEPWAGDILFDYESGVIFGKAGEIRLKYISGDRDRAKYTLTVGDYVSVLTIETYSYKNEQGERVYDIEAKALKSEDCKTTLQTEAQQQLYQIAPTCLSAIYLDAAKRLRKKNPDASVISLEYLGDVHIDFQST